MLRITLRAFAAAFFFGSVTALAQAQTPSPAPSPSSLPEITHVYTSDRSDETLSDAARTTYVITREQIERNGYRTLADAIASVPGIELSPYGPIGSGVQFGIRGSSSAQVLVLFDGLPAPGSFSDTVELGTLPTLGVERIEIVEGGGSTLYGTGAIGGIINVITGRPSRFSLLMRAGSFADREVQIETPSIQFSRIVARNDFSLPDGSTQPNNDFASSALHAGLHWRLGTFDAAARAGILADHLGAPGPEEFLSPSSREDDLNQNVELALSKQTAQSQLALQFGGTRQQITFGCDPANDPNCFQSGQSLNTEDRLDISARNVVTGSTERLLYGIDLSRGSVRADAGGGTAYISSAIAQTAAYVQHSSQRSWGRLYAGLRAERDGALGGEISPSIGAIARLTPTLSIKANAATAFRAPDASELYFPGYGNPGLHPERAKVADMAVAYSTGFSSASIGWFENRTNDLIVPVLIDPVNFVFAPENVGHALIEGLTLDVRGGPVHGLRAGLNVTDLFIAEDRDAQTRLPDDPVFTANLNLEYSGQGIVEGFGLSARLAGKRGLVDSSEPRYTQPIAYGTLTAYVQLRLATDLALTLRGDNLGNQRYAAVNGYPMPGRSFMAELLVH